MPLSYDMEAIVTTYGVPPQSTVTSPAATRMVSPQTTYDALTPLTRLVHKTPVSLQYQFMFSEDDICRMDYSVLQCLALHQQTCIADPLPHPARKTKSRNFVANRLLL